MYMARPAQNDMWHPQQQRQQRYETERNPQNSIKNYEQQFCDIQNVIRQFNSFTNLVNTSYLWVDPLVIDNKQNRISKCIEGAQVSLCAVFLVLPLSLNMYWSI